MATLEYGKPQARLGWPWMLFFSLASLAAVALWFGAKLLWMVTMGDGLTVTVTNASTAELELVQLVAPEASTGLLIDFGKLAPGKSSKTTMNFKTDRGPALLHFKSANREQTLQCGFLLNDDGPYRWHIQIADGTATLRGANGYISGRLADGPPQLDVLGGEVRVKDVWD